MTSEAIPAELPVFDLTDPSLYQNRELSWLDFNQRVLWEAHDLRNPLLERVKFLAIAASNLDEFYAKRVGWLKRSIRSDPRQMTVDGRLLGTQLEMVRDRCVAMQREMDALWADTLRPELATEGIKLVPFEQMDADDRERLTAYFQSAIYPLLTPLVVDPAHPFPFISGGSLSLAVNVRDPLTRQERFARVKVPQNRPRFVEGGEHCFVAMEDLIAAHIPMLFPGMEVTDRQALRVTRSAEIGSPGEESDDLLELIENELRRRRLAEAVSLSLSGPFSQARLELLLEELELREEDTYQTDGLLGLADLMQLATINVPHLAEPALVPTIPSAFAASNEPLSIFEVIRERDVLVHHPYESFDATVARFIDEAANDPAVLAIKQTMYRTSPDSPILASLIEASGRGKQVAVLVELTARFDEANNIEWARRLEDAGVHVAYGNPAQKIHSKICLVVREEITGVRLYAHIGTGNYNSRTARIYTDLGLFTADPNICADLVPVFNHLTGFASLRDSRELWVAPVSLRASLEAAVQREIRNARAGRPARVVFKINALEDRDLTQLLYEASQAGVKVDLIVRGICRLRPGIPGLSENVRVISIIGRFLEHSRVYRFENDGHPEIFIGSADIMKRNLDERTEVVTPIHRVELRLQIEELLDLMLADRRQAWELRDETWERDQTVTEPGVHAVLMAGAPFS